MPSTLGLVRATTAVTEWVGRIRKKPHPVIDTFLEWSVDGTPLRQLITDSSDNAVAPPQEEVTCLMDRYPDEAVEQIDRLLGRVPADFDVDRVALLVCPLCLDLGCGAVSAQLIIADETIEWRDLGWQTSLQDGFTPFTPELVITFNRRQYEDTLTVQRARYRPVAGTNLSRHGDADGS